MVEMYKHFLDFLEISHLRRLLGAIFDGQHEQPDIHKVFLDMTGGTHATAIMLASALQWDARMRNQRDGWWYKSDSSWLREVGLSRHDVEKARKLLPAAGVESEKRIGPDGREIWFYRVNPDTFWLRFSTAVKLGFEQLYDLIERLVYSEKFAGTMRKIHMVPAENPHGHSEKFAPSMRKTDNVYTSGTQPQSSAGISAGQPAVEERACALADENPAATNGDSGNPQEKLQKANDKEFSNSSGSSSPPPTAPPPVPPVPRPRDVVAANPLWQAFAGEWVEPPVIPEALAGQYLEVLQKMQHLGATAEEVTALTRRKLDEKRRLRERGVETHEYRWRYLPDDLPEERERSRSGRAWVRRLTQSPYAQFYANYSQFAPVGA